MIIQKEHGKVVTGTPSQREKFKMVAKTMVNLEEVLADELRALGAENVTPITRAVEFEGDMRLLYRANYCCRTALAILKPFAEFDADDDQQLYDQVYRIRWEKIMDVTPMKKWMSEDEVADYVIFLTLTNKSMSGQNLLIDNGERDLNSTFVWPDYKL